jgi:hypothetical protein
VDRVSALAERLEGPRPRNGFGRLAPDSVCGENHDEQDQARSDDPGNDPQRTVREEPPEAAARDGHPDERYAPSLPGSGAPAITEPPRLEPHLPAEESLFFLVDLPILRLVPGLLMSRLYC